MADSHRTPGQLVESLLAEQGWDQQVLATVLGIDKATVSRIISGKKSVDAETAIALSEVFGIRPERFLELQQAYDLAKALITLRPNRDLAQRAALFGKLPVLEMIERGWLRVDSIRDIAKVESELSRFFGVESVAEIEILPHAAKKTDTTTPVSAVQLSWIYRVKQLAAGMIVPKYSHNAVLTAIEKLSTLLRSAEEARNVHRILAEAGIRFVIVESLKSANIDGVCLWLDDQSPVIGMSLRFDRIDNFWFVLRHELEHVLRLHGRNAILLDTDLEGERASTGPNISEKERVANHAASDFCVPAESIEQFVARKAPVFAERDVLGFANTLQLHPGLVAGQLQHRTNRFEILRKHLVKIRSVVSPGAVIDGWGDVAPA